MAAFGLGRPTGRCLWRQAAWLGRAVACGVVSRLRHTSKGDGDERPLDRACGPAGPPRPAACGLRRGSSGSGTEPDPDPERLQEAPFAPSWGYVGSFAAALSGTENPRVARFRTMVQQVPSAPEELPRVQLVY
jgi:hypothetical protein